MNPIPVDEQQEEKEQNIPFPRIEETRTISYWPKTCPLWEQTNNFCRNFHTRNSSNDVRFRIRMPMPTWLPIVGLVVTLVALYYFIITVGRIKDWNLWPHTYFLYLAYFVLAAGAAVELWWGLKTNDRKHINVWISLKAVEMFAMMFALLYFLVYDQSMDYRYHFLGWFRGVFYYIFIMGLNSGILYSVLQSTKHPRNNDDHTISERY